MERRMSTSPASHILNPGCARLVVESAPKYFAMDTHIDFVGLVVALVALIVAVYGIRDVREQGGVKKN